MEQSTQDVANTEPAPAVEKTESVPEIAPEAPAETKTETTEEIPPPPPEPEPAPVVSEPPAPEPLPTPPVKEEPKPIVPPPEPKPEVAKPAAEVKVEQPRPQSQSTSHIVIPANPYHDRTVILVKKYRKKAGIDQYLVIFDGDKNETGHWVNASHLNCPQMIEEFKQNQKKTKAELAEAKNKPPVTRTIKEIIGIVPGDQISFLVRFKDSHTDELIPRSTMHKHYAKTLLRFYEEHIEIRESAKK